MSDAPAPKAENGILFAGDWRDEHLEFVQARWKSATVSELGPFKRFDLSNSPRGSCPGYNDVETLTALSLFGLTFGFFCDGINGAEGVRVFEQGRDRERHRVDWDAPDIPDPIAWPISTLAMTLRIPVEQVTRVERPPRPAIALAVEGLLTGETPDDSELTYTALQILGSMPLPEAGQVLIDRLKSEDWVQRFHAAKGYARVDRGQGLEERPALQALLDDEDESVREAALEGIQELLHSVEFSNERLHSQIDAAIARGLADEDEDVVAAATAAQDLRRELLG